MVRYVVVILGGKSCDITTLFIFIFIIHIFLLY